jgi:hypothetical protein
MTMTRSFSRKILSSSALVAWGAAFIVSLVSVACASTPGPNPSGGVANNGASTCGDSRSKATDKLQAVVDANLACTKDEDCVTIDFGASCFDACTRTIAKSGQGAFDAARGEVDQNECKAYKDAACPNVVPPPCAPPQPVACKEGKCI